MGGGPYRPGSGVEPPRLLKEVRADYTEQARRANIIGEVVLEIVVRRDGSVGDVSILQRLGSGLDERADRGGAAMAVCAGTAQGHAGRRGRRSRRRVQTEMSHMETLLLAITALSVVVAAVASIAALRVARAERARSAARVAALSAAALRHDIPAGETTPHAAPAAVAPPVGAPTAPVSRVSPFAPARPAGALAAARLPDLDIYPDERELPLKPSVAAPVAAASSRAMTESFLGMASRESSGGAQRGLAAAALVLFAVVGVGAYWLIARGDATTAQASAVAASASAPLELISLRHERQGSRLTLSGLIRNPPAGAALDGLTAVVFLFDAQGGFISSARAGVDFKRLVAGDESPFVVTIEAPSQVARYRVSFRTEAGVVTHVDRRAEQPPATALASGTN